VHAFVEWDRGPRSGIADYVGRPHVFRSDWTDIRGDKEEATFFLLSMDEQAFRSIMAVLDDQTRHPRWGSPRGEELTRGTKYPHLMSDSAPFDRLWFSLVDRLQREASSPVLLAGEFRPVDYSDEELIRLLTDLVPLEVLWTVPLEAGRA
jgi:hypothetical protein